MLVRPDQNFYPVKVEEYVSSLEKLTTDMRFTLYNILYKRILVIWIFSAFMVLIGILFRYIREKLTFSRPAETDPYDVIHWISLNAFAVGSKGWPCLGLASPGWYAMHSPSSSACKLHCWYDMADILIYNNLPSFLSYFHIVNVAGVICLHIYSH